MASLAKCCNVVMGHYLNYFHYISNGFSVLGAWLQASLIQPGFVSHKRGGGCSQPSLHGRKGAQIVTLWKVVFRSHWSELFFVAGNETWRPSFRNFDLNSFAESRLIVGWSETISPRRFRNFFGFIHHQLDFSNTRTVLQLKITSAHW